MQYSYLEELADTDITYLYFSDTTPKPPIPELPMFRWTGGQWPVPLNRVAQMEMQKSMLPKNILYIGEEFVMTNHFINEGKAAKGITINLVGNGLEGESLAFGQVELFEGSNPVAKATLDKVAFQDGRKGYSVNLVNAEIDNSITYSEYSKAITLNKLKAKGYRPYTIRIFGKVLNTPDEQELYLFVHPNENYTDGNFQTGLVDFAVFKEN